MAVESAPFQLLFLLSSLACNGVSLSLSECGNTKGCISVPAGCTGSSCNFIFSHSVNGSFLEMELQGRPPSGGFVAVAFSRDNAMGDDSLSVCYGASKQGLGFTAGRSASLLTGNAGQQNLLSSSSSDSLVYCKLRRALSAGSDAQKVFALNGSFFILLAAGGMSGQTMHYHDQQRWPTGQHDILAFSATSPGRMSSPQPSATSFSTNSPLIRSNDDKLRIAHGICMTLAWMVFLSTGILFARFFRDHLASFTPFGTRVWFHMHRIVNTIAIALTVCGFVLIFVSTGWRWDGPRAFQSVEQNQSWLAIHCMVGLLACVIAWAQPLNAVFRCHPGQTGRFIFNSIHRFFGFGAWLLAAAAIMIACVHFEGMFSNRAAAFGLFIAFLAAFGIAFILMQLLQIIGWWQARKGGDNIDVVTSDGTTKVIHLSSTSGVRRLTGLLFLPYLVVAIGTAVAICVLIGLKPVL